MARIKNGVLLRVYNEDIIDGKYKTPEGVTIIGGWAFEGCVGLKSVTIPSSVIKIGYCAFRDCRKLKSITIPSSVISIGSLAFPDGVKLIRETSRDDVTNIKEKPSNVCECRNSNTL